MKSSSIVQTRTGRLIDLSAPKASDIDFTDDIALTLAQIPRFTGHCGRGLHAWTVGEHCMVGADWLYARHQSARLSALFLLHDAHEALLGDITTPALGALCAAADAAFQKDGVAGGDVIRSAMRTVKRRIDAAIYVAAGVSPPDDNEAEIIRLTDLRLLKSEMLQLMGGPHPGWTADFRRIEPLHRIDGLRPTGKPGAIATGWLMRLDKWSPGARTGAAAARLERTAS